MDVVLPEPLTPATMTTVGPIGVVVDAVRRSVSRSLSCCLTNASTSPVISLSRNAWRTLLDDLAGGGGADVGEVEALLQLVEEIADPPCRAGGTARRCRRRRRASCSDRLSLSKKARKTMNYLVSQLSLA